MGSLSYLGAVKTPTKQIAAEISNKFNLPSYGAPYNSPVIWGYNADGAEHGTGRALDIMVQHPGATGDAIADYLWANRSRFGVIHILWRQRIKSSQVAPGVWRAMANRGSPTNNHMDHIHVLFDGRSVSGTPSAPSRPASSSGFYKPTGNMSVKEIQKAVGVSADGLYGSGTKTAVAKLQRSLGLPADGLWGDVTERAYKHSKSPKPEPGGGVKAPKFPLPKGSYFGPKSGPASSVSGHYGHSADLKKWQARMKQRGWSISVDGYYGPGTEKVVKQFQKQLKIKVDGKIGIRTWESAWTAPVT